MDRKMIGIVILASLVSGFLGGMIVEWMERPAYSETPKVLKADVIQTHAISLVDPQGNTKAVLSATNSGTMLEMDDSHGKPRVDLIVAKGLPAFGLNDSQGNLRMLLTVDKTGPSADFFDAHGKKKMSLGNRNSSEGFGLYDSNGRLRSMIGWGSRKPGSPIRTGESSIVLFDKKGRVMWQEPK